MTYSLYYKAKWQFTPDPNIKYKDYGTLTDNLMMFSISLRAILREINGNINDDTFEKDLTTDIAVNEISTDTVILEIKFKDKDTAIKYRLKFLGKYVDSLADLDSWEVIGVV